MKMKLLPLICMFLVGTSLAFSQQSLDAIATQNAPTVDGIVDNIWNTAAELVVPLGETYDNHDPASITHCAGCHSYNSAVNVKLKAVYTADKLYVLATWADPTASLTRSGSWSFANGRWEKPNVEQSEDRISFFWPIGEIKGNPYNTGGCMAKCHIYWPTDTDPHVSTHGIIDDAWLESGRADMWHSKAARGAAYLSASGTGLTIDPTTHEVTAGTLSMLGFADDKYVDVWAPDSINGEDGGRYGDAGSSGYSHNRIGDKSRPKYMEKAPTDYADAMVLTQDEINAGECVGDGTTGVSDADAATYWPAYSTLNAIVPERILSQANGSRSDLAFGAVWTNGTWIAEIARDLNTGNDDDVQFNTTAEYIFGVAEFDNSRHGYEHRTSKMYTLKFITYQPSYVGSDFCKACHPNKYNDWVESGHPYKFSVIENDQPPTYPGFVTNFEDSWMANLGDSSHTWADIAGVIGGFGWKSRFVGTDGIIIGTASSSFLDAGFGHNQSNFFGGENHGWVNYDASVENKYYNYACFKCHTTGGDTSGSWLTGAENLGTFAESGIGCESCHGPGSDHIAGPNKDNIDKVYEFAHLDNALGGLQQDGIVIAPDAEGDDVNFLCGTCHNRSYTDPINSSGGFIQHHEQWDEFVATRHSDMGFTCVTCHDPHKRVLWEGDGITKTCESCHSSQAALIKHSGTTNCIDCHMPFAAKSGTTRGQSGFKADVRSHLFTITPDTASMFTANGSAVRDDAGRRASLSPAYSCLGCHNDDPADAIADKTLEQAVLASVGMHTPTSVASDFGSSPTEFVLSQNYPNPFNPSTMISFSLPEPSFVTVKIFTTGGQLVETLVNENMSVGRHSVQFDGKNVASGLYIYSITAGENFRLSRKMMLVK